MMQKTFIGSVEGMIYCVNYIKLVENGLKLLRLLKNIIELT